MRVHTWHTHILRWTGANRFYNLSDATVYCYSYNSYGANNYITSNVTQNSVWTVITMGCPTFAPKTAASLRWSPPLSNTPIPCPTPLLKSNQPFCCSTPSRQTDWPIDGLGDRSIPRPAYALHIDMTKTLQLCQVGPRNWLPRAIKKWRSNCSLAIILLPLAEKAAVAHR